MNVLDLTTPTSPDEMSWLDDFQQGLEYSKSLPAKIYKMSFDYGVEDATLISYVLMTVSKDVWLRLGAMEESCHTNLVELLEAEFRKMTASQLLLRIENDKEMLLVTRTEDRHGDILDQVIFSFAPAH